MIGAAGNSILAVTSILGLAVIGFILVVYAAHCFLTVVIDSGSGADMVQWPSEGIFDWLLKPVYCGWLLSVWTIVFGVVLLPFLVSDPVSLSFILAGLLVAVYPITLLSSLSAKSWVALVHMPFLRRWARWPVSYVIVLVVGAGLLLFIGSMVVLSTAHHMFWIAIAVVVLPPAWLLYARLIGRYAWLVTHTPMRKKPRRKVPARVSGVAVEDPWSSSSQATGAPPAESPDEDTGPRAKMMSDEEPAKLMAEEPEEEEDEWTTEKKPYGVMGEGQAQASWQPRKTDPLGDEPGYEMDGAAPLAAPFSLTGYYEQYEKDEQKRRDRTEARSPRRPTFALAFGRGLWLFPFYGATLKPWISLGFLTLIALFLLRILVMSAREIL